jgi:hypothetical protein
MDFPQEGKYLVQIIGVEKGVSSKKKTPQINLVFTTGEDCFDDNLFVTPKTLSRLCLVAKRVCKMNRTTVLPDDDNEASIFVAKFIMANALHKQCYVTIESNQETYVVEQGPDIGQTKTINKRRVAFKGYDEYVERQPGEEPKHEQKSPEDDLPF